MKFDTAGLEDRRKPRDRVSIWRVAILPNTVSFSAISPVTKDTGVPRNFPNQIYFCAKIRMHYV
jgi:hypothetical protein